MLLSLRKRYYAFLLLRRYKLKYSTFIRMGKGAYVEYFSGMREIRVNLFDPYFWETFCHELGHHLYIKSGGRDSDSHESVNNMYTMYIGKQPYHSRLKEEAMATVAGVRVSRAFGIECNKVEMLKWFNTYTGSGYKYMNLKGLIPEYLTPLVHKLITKINKA